MCMQFAYFCFIMESTNTPTETSKDTGYVDSS